METEIKGMERYYSIQKKEWVAFRFFWIFMSLIILAAAFGLFGKGYLSDTIVNGNGYKIEFNKFMRVEKNTELLIYLNNAGENAKVSINNDYLKKVKIEQVIPEPKSVEVINNNLIYTFSSAQNGFIIFYLVPGKMGSQQLKVTINGKQMVFDQYIYF